MKANKFLLIAVALWAIVALPANVQASSSGTAPRVRTSPSSAVRMSANHWRNGNWAHHRRHSRIFFDLGFGYPFGYGYPYYGYYPYGYYPYGYGYYAGPDAGAYEAARADRSLVVQVQRRLARAGYYHGAIDGVMGKGTRSAIRSYERTHGLRVDGQIDQRLLETMD
jgi:Putative peptidoglycan binding domain